ncbi:MAG: hypothetical protein M0015_04825 [Betaproteobacteria bacterium]|nr:hypothetical protein [Betaproteobacteria bacterium]
MPLAEIHAGAQRGAGECDRSDAHHIGCIAAIKAVRSSALRSVTDAGMSAMTAPATPSLAPAARSGSADALPMRACSPPAFILYRSFRS